MSLSSTKDRPRITPSLSRAVRIQALLFALVVWCTTTTHAFVLAPWSSLSSSSTRRIPSTTWSDQRHRLGVASSLDTTDVVKRNEYHVESPDSTTNIRPLHQNWWPVTLVNALQDDRPNAVMALGMRLVLFHNGVSWTCLDDQCAHRFAPLSEGRVIPATDDATDGTKNIQCAYHGWEFDGCGACQCIPQATSSKDPAILRKSKVPNYPVRVACGVVWVWTDPATAESIAPTIQLPLSPLLKNYHTEFGDQAGFMRDLPYGMEFLGENLADLSHLPFSHHSVGSLRRDLAGPLPFRMMSEAEKRQVAKLEFKGFDDDNDGESTTLPASAVIPRFQVDLPDAGNYDPMLKSYKGGLNSTLQVGFYEPCHIRYRRTGSRLGDFNVELFLCPLDSGRSRVFLLNAFRIIAAPSSATSSKDGGWRASLSPKAWMAAMKIKLVRKMLNPVSTRSHMMSHVIFDGDGIFLHKQGERMRRSGKTFRNYEQPYAADVLLNAFRRYLDVAAKKSLEDGHVLAATSVSGANYFDNQPRSILLDRYESHTKHCSVCQEGLKKCRQREALWNVAETALIGAAGASTTGLLAAVVSSALLGPTTAVPWAVSQVLGASTVLTTAGSVLADRKKRKAGKEAETFLFQDYVHAEKH